MLSLHIVNVCFLFSLAAVVTQMEQTTRKACIIQGHPQSIHGLSPAAFGTRLAVMLMARLA